MITMTETKTRSIVIGSDHRGVKTKQTLLGFLDSDKFRCYNVGARNSSQSVDYPDIGDLVAVYLLQKTADIGILICSTGIGMSMTANRWPHIRAALVHNTYYAEMARKHNNANVLCLGSDLKPDALQEILTTFLETEFEGGRHQKRLDKFVFDKSDRNR